MQRRLSGQALRRLLGALRVCNPPAEAQLPCGAAFADLPPIPSVQRLAWSSCACTHWMALQAPGAWTQWQAARVRRRVFLPCTVGLCCMREHVQPVRQVLACSEVPLQRSPPCSFRTATLLLLTLPCLQAVWSTPRGPEEPAVAQVPPMAPLAPPSGAGAETAAINPLLQVPQRAPTLYVASLKLSGHEHVQHLFNSQACTQLRFYDLLLAMAWFTLFAGLKASYQGL